MSRQYDVVLFGATGFTGALTAEYLAKNAPPELSWALAGRNRGKLEAVRAKLGVEVDLLIADVEDPASLKTVAEATRILVTTVGPYVRYGEPLVAACAEAGTDYLDLTGESEFVDRMYVAYHAKAVETGARIIHCCGFDSIPYDLGVQFTVEQLPKNVPIKVDGLIRGGGKPSGGTWETVVTALSRGRQNLGRAPGPAPPAGPARRSFGEARAGQNPPQPRILGRAAADRRPADRGEFGDAARRLRPRFPVLPLCRCEAAADRRGWHRGARPAGCRAQLPPARKVLLQRIKAGDGPSEERRAKSWFKARFVGEGGGKRVVTEVSGGDPGYDETAKMLAECALLAGCSRHLRPRRSGSG